MLLQRMSMCSSAARRCWNETRVRPAAVKADAEAAFGVLVDASEHESAVDSEPSEDDVEDEDDDVEEIRTMMSTRIGRRCSG